MLIDCQSCAMLNTEVCEDCVVTYVFHEGLLDLETDEAEALANLAAVGLVPRLRLVPLRPEEVAS
jgi:hypothetical protein